MQFQTKSGDGFRDSISISNIQLQYTETTCAMHMTVTSQKKYFECEMPMIDEDVDVFCNTLFSNEDDMLLVECDTENFHIRLEPYDKFKLSRESAE